MVSDAMSPLAATDESEHPATISLKPICPDRCPTAIRTAWSARTLFLNYFDLFIDHLTGEPIDRNMHPVTLLTFNDKGRKLASPSKIGVNTNCTNRDAPNTYIEPSYLISTCCDWIVPSGARLGLTNT